MTAFEQIAFDLGITEPAARAVKQMTLKGCPFCGREVEILIGGTIHCGTCRALIIFATPKARDQREEVTEVMNLWNKRRKSQ